MTLSAKELNLRLSKKRKQEKDKTDLTKVRTLNLDDTDVKIILKDDKTIIIKKK